MTDLRIGRIGLVALTLLAAGLAAGCCSFEREWRDVDCCLPAGEGLAGHWEGSWLSCMNHHEGRLRAIITPCGEGQAGQAGLYHVRFHAMFWEVFPFEFALTMASVREGEVERFEGQADLGLAGGVFTYAGQADACTFTATFCSPKDHGVFSMRRVR